MRQRNFQLILLMAITAIFSCSEPTLIGSDLLEEDSLNLNFTDQTSIAGQTVQGDILQTYSPFTAAKLDNSLLGSFDDADFGKGAASIYTQFALGTQAAPDVVGATVDSIILSLAFDTTLAGYGDLTQAFEIEVFSIGEDLQNVESYFSDQTFLISRNPIGSATITPILDTVILNSYVTDALTLDTLAPHIRIPLNESFGELFLQAQDTTLFESTVALQEVFKGLHITATSPNGGILNLDFSQVASRISLYYSTTVRLDVIQHEYQFDFNEANSRTVNLTSDVSNSTVEPFIGTGLDSLLFVQGMQGVNTEISFPDLSDLQDIIVNRAELEFTVATSANTVAGFPLPTQLSITTLEEDGLNLITDLQSVIIQQGILNSLENFGGQLVEEMENGTLVFKYKINISDHFQKILDGEVENKVTISAGVEQPILSIAGQPFRLFDILPAKASNASRAAFFGPNHSQYPAKLNLTFTKL